MPHTTPAAATIPWWERRDNALTETDFSAARLHAETYARYYNRHRRTGITDELEVSSACMRGAWYAYCTYPRGAAFPFETHYRLTIRQWAHRAKRWGGTDEGWELRQSTLSLEADVGDYSQPVEPWDDLIWLIQVLLATLPPAERQLIYDTYWSGYTSREFVRDRTTVQKALRAIHARLNKMLVEEVPWTPLTGSKNFFETRTPKPRSRTAKL